MLLALMVGTVGMLVSLWLWHADRTEQQRRTRERFEGRVAELRNAIVARMSAYEQVLRGGVSLFATLGTVSRTQWRDYVRHLELERNYPGIHGVGWAAHVAGPDLAAFERTQRGQGLTSFAVRPPGPRDQYAPVTYLEPNTERNLRAHGFDMLSEPFRGEAMAKARDSGRAAITARLKLASEAEASQAYGFLMYLPVYRTDAPIATIDERRHAFLGFVNSPFRMVDLMRGITGDGDDRIDLEIFDGDGVRAETLMHDSDQVLRALEAPEPFTLSRTLTISVAGRPWTLHFASMPAFDDQDASREPAIVLASGLGVSLLLAGLVGLISSRVELLRRARQRDERLRHTDPLTGLPDRTRFHLQLDSAIARSVRDGRRIALMFIDLDNFKLINDSEGHGAGDLIIQAAAQRLLASARANDMVCRLGGDEFTIILDSVHAPDEARVVADRIVHSMTAAIEINGRPAMVSASVGIALWPDDGRDADVLLSHADAAMHQAKQRGKRQYQFYTAATTSTAARQLRVESRLREALASNSFQLAFQPVVRLDGGELSGFEALLRLPPAGAEPGAGDTRGESVTTTELILAAERCGMISAVGDWVIEAACRQWAAWPREATRGLTLAINVSAGQFLQEAMPQRLRSAMAAHGIEPGSIELELTETALLEDGNDALRLMQSLRALGVAIVLDDFGTGYASLSYLKRLPIDKLKIDQSFLRDLDREPDDAHILEAIIDMAHSLKLTVVAEGIETDTQLALLRRLGCGLGQGHLLCPPLAAEEVQVRFLGWRRDGAGAGEGEGANTVDG